MYDLVIHICRFMTIHSVDLRTLNPGSLSIPTNPVGFLADYLPIL